MLDIMIGVALETAAYDGALDTAPGARYHVTSHVTILGLVRHVQHVCRGEIVVAA